MFQRKGKYFGLNVEAKNLAADRSYTQGSCC